MGLGRFQGDILDRTFRFGVRVVRMAMALPRNPAVAVLVRQDIASGTSLGANLREANHALTRKAFLHRVVIAAAECCETGYWRDVIVGAGIVERRLMEPLIEECREIERILAAIVRRTKRKAGL